jgi:hypothetical protein
VPTLVDKVCISDIWFVFVYVNSSLNVFVDWIYSHSSR